MTEDIGPIIVDQNIDLEDTDGAIEALERFESIIEKAVTEGLEPSDMIVLYQIALTAAVDELHRIEHQADTPVNPAVLTLIQQISLLCHGPEGED